jgi:signal transduction histidine kinase
MNTYELPVAEESPVFESLATKGIADATVKNNAGWFIKLRWFVISVFFVFGLAGLIFRSGLSSIGLSIPYSWLWILAAVLLAANIPLFLTARKFNDETTHNAVFINVWLQIALDLSVITALVHAVGTIETFVSFAYLFHIVLACIFFPPRKSLLVTAIAAALYLGVVALETAGILPYRSILSTAQYADSLKPVVRMILALFGVTIWFIVWYIASTLSKTVRQRDQQLSVANEQLKIADEEKNRQMLITTHDLKAPFAGIESNIEALKYQFWEEIPQKVRKFIDNIDNRAHILRDRINAILILGNLKSAPASSIVNEKFDLSDFMRGLLEPLKEKAAQKEVKIVMDISPITIQSDKEQLSTLFSNLLANAIAYSHDKGTVFLGAETAPSATSISIRDEGIGIRDDALPEIFDEYFRTKEASKFNRQSTGLGLAIVKVIAQKLKLRVSVQSEQGAGTTFTIAIPK